VIQISTFLVSGLLAARIERNRRTTEAQYKELQRQIVLRKEAEEQWTSFINTSLTAILTTDRRGTVLFGNRSGGRLFAGEDGAIIEGDNILSYMPFLVLPDDTHGSQLMLRTMLEGRALRKDQSVFYAQVWVSCYQTSAGLRMSVIVWDGSEQRREYEELGLRQLLASSHILTGAVAHEIRNLSAAISLHHHALSTCAGTRH
jgi:PAS domain-containing protein